eukprot:13804257-Ditylum_brightwellii.AAC.1
MEDAKEFNKTHKDETDFDGNVINHTEDFSLWVFGVRKGLVNETGFRIKPDDEELKSYFNTRQKERILPPT